MRRLGLITVTLAVAVAGPGAAAPPWSEPITVGKSRPDIGPLLLVGGDGELLLHWATVADRHRLRSAETEHQARYRSNGVWSAEQHHSESLIAHANGNFRATTKRLSRGGDRLRLVELTRNGRLIRHRVADVRALATYNARPDGRGGAVIAWTERRGANYVARLRRYTKARGLSPLVKLGRSSSYPNIRVVTGPSGRIAVIYPGELDIRVVVVQGKRGITHRLTAGPHDGFAYADAAYSSDGRLMLVWTSQPAGEFGVGSDTEPYAVTARRLEPGARTLSRAQLLEGGMVSEPPNGPPRVVAFGNLFIATWPGRSDGDLHAAVAEAGGDFGGVQSLDSEGFDASLAVWGQAQAMAVWTHSASSSAPEELRAAFLAARSSRFTPSETIVREPLLGGSAAFDPSTGEPVVAWAGIPGATTRNVPNPPYVVRFARRPPPPPPAPPAPQNR